MIKPKFKIDDKVLVRYKAGIGDIMWNRRMNIYNNTVQTIKDFRILKHRVEYYLEGVQESYYVWHFDEKWLMPPTELGKIIYGD